MPNQPLNDLSDEERDGVRMIQGLQLLIGVVEDRERALYNWRRMTVHEREQTRCAYAILCAAAEEDETA